MDIAYYRLTILICLVLMTFKKYIQGPVKPEKFHIRKFNLFAPLGCYVCGEEIKTGDRYYNHIHKETHERCITGLLKPSE